MKASQDTHRPELRRSIRTRFLDAGLELFGTLGYEGTTIAHLAKEANASTRDFYRHIGNRIDLFIHVFDREAHRLDSIASAATADIGPQAGTWARAWMKAWFDEMIADQRRYRILYAEAHGIDDELERHRRSWLRSTIVHACSCAQRCAEFRGIVQPDEYWRVPVTALIAGTRETLQQYTEGELPQPDSEAVVESYARLVALVLDNW